MARNFNGGSDRLINTLNAHATQRTWACWSYRQGDGGLGFGRFFDKFNGATNTEFAYNGLGLTGVNAYWFQRHWSVSGGREWGIARPAPNTWFHLAICYDSGSTANAPTIYANGVAQSLFVGGNVPSGVPLTTAGQYVIGNRSDAGRGWHGSLCEFATWDRLLAPAEAAALGRGVSPLFFPRALVSYSALVRDLVDRCRGPLTAVGTTVVDHPRITYPGADWRAG